MVQILEHQLIKVRIADLKEDPENPNEMTERQEGALDAGFDKFGFLVPIVIDQNNKIRDGHHRVKRLRAMGIEEVQAYRVQIDNEADAEILRQALQLHGKDDPKKYAAKLKMVFESNKLDELAKLLAQPKENFERVLAKHYGMQFVDQDNFDIEAILQAEPETKKGDVWQCGPHKVMCGDCTDSDAVKRFFGDKRVDELITDPPYGVAYSDKNSFLNDIDHGTRIQTPIINDAINDYREFFAKFLKAIPFADYNTCYIFMAGQELHNLRLAMDDADIKWSDYLIWVKNHHVLGRKDYNARHEFIAYGWKNHHKFYGGVSNTVLEFNKAAINKLHPTMKPIALLGRLIKDGSEAGALVYDPFGGSGSTLIACEQTGRTCYTIEQDPRYVDVIVKRWEAFTGKKAEKVDG